MADVLPSWPSPAPLSFAPASLADSTHAYTPESHSASWREQSSMATRPSQNRRDQRAQRARDMRDRDIPDVLRGSPRARHGIHKADLIVDPDPVRETPPSAPSTFPAPSITIRVQCADTLSAAATMSERPFANKRAGTASRANVTILNMASQLRPGGGFLDGANSQEEFICARTTLYPSLWDSFYCLPDVGGVHTPDVLVFRDHLPEANELMKRDRFFVDVISAGMLRFADARAEGCSCGVSYCDRHRDLVARKMKAVLRIAQLKGADRLVLGAWGCGAYGNPVREIARLWRKVIAGAARQRRPNAERWDGVAEIVFAIPDRTMLREFEVAFDDILATNAPEPNLDLDVPAVDPSEQDGNEISELLSRIAETEMQMDQIHNPRLRARKLDTLAVLQRELAQGLAARASRDEDLSPDEALEADGFVVGGYPRGGDNNDDEEDGGFYHFDENDVASDSSALSSSPGTASEVYEFRAPLLPALEPSAALRPNPLAQQHTSSSAPLDPSDSRPGSLAPSPRFDPQTGWFAGSMDQLSALLRNGGSSSSSGGGFGASGPDDRKASPTASPPHPQVLRPESSNGLDIDELALRQYLARYEGTDVPDE